MSAGRSSDANALYRALFDCNPLPMWIHDSDKFRILAVNDAALRVYDYTRTEFLKLDATQLWHPSFISENPEDLLRNVSSSVRSGPFSHRSAAGKVLTVEIDSYPIQFESRSGLLIVVHNMNEEHALRKDLRFSEERYRSLFDEAPVGYHELDRSGRIVSVNRTELDLLGYDLDDMFGHFIWEFAANSEQSKGATLRKLAGEQPAGKSYERAFKRKDGSELPLLVEDRILVDDSKSILGIRTTVQDMTYRKQMEEALRRSEEQFRTFFEEDATADALTLVDGTISECNMSFVKMFGFKSREQALGSSILRLYPNKENRASLLELLRMKRKLTEHELELKRVDGTSLFIRANFVGIFDGEGKLVKIRQYLIDETERKSLERQLIQAQKLEGIGRLAGGVAHDYNNILGVILGYAELAVTKLLKDDPLYHDLESILNAANRGGELTRQLLAFARREIVSPKILNLNPAIESIRQMLQRLMGENIKLSLNLKKELWNTKIDPTQFDQILINLSSNSRDAIDDVGTVSIETSNVKIEENYVLGHRDFLLGEYVVVSFTDDGRGMDRDTQEKIFEPFFTTKPKGAGTGLGMSTVYGIVKQNGGNINVYSEPGKGTTIRVYLPRAYGREETGQEVQGTDNLAGNATILVVEDQADLLELAKKSLEEYGYKVLSAWTPGEAILLCEAYNAEIQVLLTDVIMPVMNGKELRDRVLKMRPAIKTLFMSGYTADVIAHRGILDEGINFIQKPFTPRALAKAIRDVLK